MRRPAATAVVVAVAACVLIGGVWFWWYCLKEWGAWHDFAARFIQEDGRVIDFAASDRSTSEGQSYAMFFAFVADDRDRFEDLLGWTVDNLAEGDLSSHLPAWSWGKREDGSWGVLDDNPASDADLWIAYSLLHAGRSWQRPDYVATADALLANIASEEVVDLPQAGKMLLPAPRGFHAEDGSWRLNPSYVPGFLLQALGHHNPSGPWLQIRQTADRLLRRASPLGLAPDWYTYTADGDVVADTEYGPRGSYDAIRVYLWAALSAELGQSSGLTPEDAMAKLTAESGVVPESVDTETGEASGSGPAGFAGALLPYVEKLENKKLRNQLSESLVEHIESADAQDEYYDRVLILFGSGWYEDRYRITGQGRTAPRWSRNCCEILQ